MTDKELLTLAAKAAGIIIDKSTTNGGGARNTGFNMLGDAILDWHNNKRWNPLTDDGDALRLAVKLRVDLRFEQELAGWDVEAGSCGENCKSDPYAATRRAIVRAAAEIGKTA